MNGKNKYLIYIMSKFNVFIHHRIHQRELGQRSFRQHEVNLGKLDNIIFRMKELTPINEHMNGFDYELDGYQPFNTFVSHDNLLEWLKNKRQTYNSLRTDKNLERILDNTNIWLDPVEDNINENTEFLDRIEDILINVPNVIEREHLQNLSNTIDQNLAYNHDIIFPLDQYPPNFLDNTLSAIEQRYNI